MKKYKYLGENKRLKEAEEMLAYLQQLREGFKATEALLAVGWSPTKLYALRRKYAYFDEKCRSLLAVQFHASVPVNESFDIIDMGFSGSRYLYFVRAEGHHFVKIGITSDPIRRLKGLQASCPIRLWFDKVIKGASDYERLIHIHLYQLGLHSHGEWFEAKGQAIAMRLLNEFSEQGAQA